VGRSHNGIAEIEGITEQQRAAFSRRLTEIDQYMEEHGLSGPEARQIAAVRTRHAKDYDVTPAELAPGWRTRGAELGLDADAIADVLNRGEFRAVGTTRNSPSCRTSSARTGSCCRRRHSIVVTSSAASRARQQGVTGEEIEVRNLNAAARALIEDEGRLGPARLKLPGGEFVAGSRRRTCQGGQDRLRPLAEPAVHANLRS
jgi:hypothetical protein